MIDDHVEVSKVFINWFTGEWSEMASVYLLQ